MRRAFYCLAAGVTGLMAAGYLADTARSDARITALGGAFSIERASKGDRLPAFAVKALPRSTGVAVQNVGGDATENLTVVARKAPAVTSSPSNAIEVRSPGKDVERVPKIDRDVPDEARPKKRGTKMMDGCESSVSPLSPASAQAREARCVAVAPALVRGTFAVG